MALLESGLAFRVGGGLETLVMEKGERDGITVEADRAVLQVAMKVNAVMEVGVMLSTDGSVSPCEGRPERASKAGCGAVIGAAPRLGWTGVGRIGHGLDRGATTSAMTLASCRLSLSCLVGEQDGDLLETINNLRLSLCRLSVPPS